MFMHDIKWDGNKYHASFWNKHMGRREHVGTFFNKSTAERERRIAIKKAHREANGLLNI